MITDLLLQSWTRLATDASIFLIVGGLCILGLVVVLVVLRTAFPSGKPRAGGITTGPLPRRLANTPSVPLVERTPVAVGLDPASAQRGHDASQKVRVNGLDDIMDAIINNGWGNARVLRLKDDRAVVRYYQCSDCAPGTGAENQPNHGCSFQAGYLRGAFSKLVAGEVRATETACRAQGHPVCEFEVAFA